MFKRIMLAFAALAVMCMLSGCKTDEGAAFLGDPADGRSDESLMNSDVSPEHDYAYSSAMLMYGTINSFLKSVKKQGIELVKLDEPHTALVEIRFGGYSAYVDEELIPEPEKMGEFCIRLCDTLEDKYGYSDGWINAYIVNGECKGVVFMSSADGGQLTDYPSYEDFERGGYHWDSADDVGYVNGIAMGVYPELPYLE